MFELDMVSRALPMHKPPFGFKPSDDGARFAKDGRHGDAPESMARLLLVNKNYSVNIYLSSNFMTAISGD
jgi:hypothetical protein